MRVGYIGVGLMGHGIAQVFAVAGHDVTITDPSAGSLASVKERISANLKDLGDDPKAVDRVTPVAVICPSAIVFRGKFSGRKKRERLG